MITVTDLFCGAGGSSLGAEQTGKFRLRWALNHDKVAIGTHNRNFPHADHDCTDISACNPKRYEPTTVLIASPECTNHTIAKGQKRKNQNQLKLMENGQPDPAEERSRATMWDVVRFAEAHDYEAVVVENVVDARFWRTWDAWLMAMHLLGYDHQCVFFNSMFAHLTPNGENDFVPQSRDRLYVIFWKKRLKKPNLDFRPVGYCEKCGRDVEAVQVWKSPNRKWGKYGKNGQYIYQCPNDVKHGEVVPYYYGAWTAIDFGLPIERIGDRKRPLVDRTISRIKSGLARFGKKGIVIQQGDKAYTAPFLLQNSYTHGHNNRNYSVDGPAPTIDTGTRPYLVVPTVFNNQGKGSIDGILEPMNTICTSATHKWLLTAPMIYSYQSTENMKGLDAPLPTVTTKDKNGLLLPPSFTFSYANGDGPPRPTNMPLHTINTGYNSGLVVNIDPENIDIDDCLYRILEPQEIKAGMAFPDSYVIEGKSKAVIVKQCGNAVTPPVMKMILERIAQILGYVS